MSIWYAILNALGLPMFEMDFMKTLCWRCC